MANRQNQNNGREQVELNLNPIALQPTIRNGGNYRVAVQQTPKTNSALQLAEALRKGVGLYGQAVELAQDKAATDVETMSEEDFDKFLTEGLDKESRNIFGYTKAYNRALAKKYYAEEMPTKLQAIAAELHKDPYAYKDPAQFEGAAIAAVNEAYDEADELLGGNVFSEQANNALKSATKADFVAKQQATYLERMPQITRQNASEGAFNAFSNITKADDAKAVIDAQITSVTEAVGNRKEAAALVTKAYLDNIEALAKQEGQEGLAQQLLDELHSGEDEEKAGLQGKRQFGVDKVELFNTAENRGRIEDLEDIIDRAGVSGYNAKIARAKEATANIQLDVYTRIKGEGGSEEAGLTRLNELRDEIVKNQSLTLGDSTFNDSIEITEILNFIDGAASNRNLFVHNAKLSFVQQNTGSKRAAPNQIKSAGSIAKLNLDASKFLYASGFDSEGRQSINLTPMGQTVISEFNSELEQLELGLADSLLSNTALSDGDKITEYSKLYPSEVTAKMQEWMINRLDNVVPLESMDSLTVSAQRDKDAVDFLDEKTRAKIKASAQDVEEENELLDHYIQEVKDDVIAERTYQVFETKNNNLFVDNDDKPKMESAEDEAGNRILRSDVGYGTAPKLLEKSYDRATENNLFRDTEERRAGHAQLVSGWQNPDKTNPSATYRGTSFKDRAYARYLAEGYFFKDTPIEKAAKRKKMAEHYGRYGVDISEVITDEANFKGFTRTKRNVTISEMFGGEDKVDFRRFPITVNGSVETVALTVSDYFKAKEAGRLEKFYAGDFDRVAEKYFQGDLDALMTAQRTYLLKHKFITK